MLVWKFLIEALQDFNMNVLRISTDSEKRMTVAEINQLVECLEVSTQVAFSYVNTTDKNRESEENEKIVTVILIHNELVHL